MRRCGCSRIWGERINFAALDLWAALWFALPVIGAGAVHIAVIRSGALANLARFPLDSGISFGGRRLFGANKTLRGLVVMPLAGGALATLLDLIPNARTWCVSIVQAERPFLWGAALGAGYLLGELPNSFLKRRLDIAPGDAAHGNTRAIFWILDQIDSLLGVLAVALLFGSLPIAIVEWLLVITLVIHPFAAWVMKTMGLKRRVG